MNRAALGSDAGSGGSAPAPTNWTTTRSEREIWIAEHAGAAYTLIGALLRHDAPDIWEPLAREWLTDWERFFGWGAQAVQAPEEPE